MKRKDFLKNGLGLLGMATVLMPITACKDSGAVAPADSSTGTEAGGTGSCSLTDTETDGPYPLYNSRGSALQRTDIADGKTGLPLNMAITIRNINDGCNVVSNARVDIWHCDKDGYYSGYSNSGYLGTQNNTGKVFCRGLQYTSADGQARFTTIYPGWYQGRVTHIHVQVYVGSALKLTSQIAFPEEINTAVYNTELYKAHGQNPTKNTTDNIIRDSLDNELAAVIGNGAGGYDLVHTIYISA